MTVHCVLGNLNWRGLWRLISQRVISQMWRVHQKMKTLSPILASHFYHVTSVTLRRLIRQSLRSIRRSHPPYWVWTGTSYVPDICNVHHEHNLLLHMYYRMPGMTGNWKRNQACKWYSNEARCAVTVQNKLMSACQVII